MKIVHGTTESVRAKVSFRREGAYVDISQDTVEMAFPAAGVAVEEGDFNTAAWEVNDEIDPPDYIASCLVGPGGVDLDVGAYDIYVRVTDDPEIPIKQVDDTLDVVDGLI